jgi:hypothetical protein
MAPVRNASKEQRLAASRGRADNLLNQIRLERVFGVLKDVNNKALLYEYESKLIQEGYLEPLSLAPKKKVLKAIKDDDATLKQPTNSDSDAEDDDNKEFCRNTNKFGDLKFAVWARAFKLSEPSIFTKANVKSMQKRGERETSLKSMQVLGEYLADVNLDDRIDKSMRTKKKIIRQLVSLYHKKGRRGRNVVMPINYRDVAPIQDEEG